MSFGVSPDDIGFLIIGMLAALLIPAVLYNVGRLLGWATRLRWSAFPLLFMLAAIVGLVIGGSLYLDAAGHTIDGLVKTKQERVELRREGDWRHRLQAAVAYRQDGALPKANDFASADSTVSLNLGPSQYDALREGEPVALKVLPLWRSITLVRLASTGTREWIPWGWLAIGLGALALGWLGYQIGRSRAGCLVVLAAVALAAVGLPALVVYREWRAMEDLSAKPLRAQAIVRTVTRVTEIDPLPCRSGCRRSMNTKFDVPQQYDIVQMAFTPQGARDEVLAVDAADVGSANVAPEQPVAIAYAPADPRAAQIVGATHSHHWKNMVAFAEISLGTLLLLALLVVFASGAGRLFRRARPRVP
jgi:hypothetical protein